MEHELIDMLRHLPVAVRIVIQQDQDSATWYLWQTAESSGKSQSLIQAVEQALVSVLTFVADDAHSSIEIFQQSLHSFGYN